MNVSHERCGGLDVHKETVVGCRQIMEGAVVRREVRSFATTTRWLRFTPHVPMLEENNARQGFVDHSVFLKLREHLPAYLKDPTTFLYLSGRRLGEMKQLEWRDIDLGGMVVRLRPEISKNKDGRVLPL